MVWGGAGGPNQCPLCRPFYALSLDAHLLVQRQAMMHVNLPHKVVAASMRTDNLFLFACLLSASRHHNTEFHVALKMEQKPKTQMFVQWFVCPKFFEWINIPAIIIWWSWSGVWSWRLTLLFMMKVLFLINVTVWYFLSSTHEGMTNCTHLLSYLQPVKCCCGVCGGISIDMFWVQMI